MARQDDLSYCEGRRVRRPATVVDLARERRIRARVDELGELLSGRPDLAERTRAMLAGELPCPDLDNLEEPMGTNDAAVNLRLPSTALDRAEAMVEALAADPMLRAAGRGVSRSTVLRLAVLRGLDSLEAELAARRKGGRK